MANEMIKGARILLECLSRLGIKEIFGYPGGAVIPIYDELYSFKDIKHYFARHEQGAVHEADGYARSTGNVGVCLATSGPGATNLVTGIMTAHMDSIPLLAITGQVTSTLLGKDAFQESDIVGITVPITKNNYLVQDIRELPRILKEAYYIASTGRPGPVLVDIPRDIQLEEIPYDEFKKLYEQEFELEGYNPVYEGHKGQIKTAIKMIKDSKKPLIIAGAGILKGHAYDELKEFVDKYHLDLSIDGNFNPRHAFGSRSDADHTYNTPRAWILQRYFNPTSNSYDGINADYRPDSDNLPWARVPEKKITVEDIKYGLSHHYQGTEYDSYSKNINSVKKGTLRPIGINRTNFLGLVQIRPYMPDELKSIQWLAVGSCVFNAIVPFYTNINRTPEYLANTTNQVTTENFYWTNRLIAALCDAHFADTASHIERYQLKVQSQSRELLNKYDEEFIETKVSKEAAKDYLEKANDKIAKELKVQTDDLLDKALFTASCNMRNKFARSDA
mgnify:CR=1 FL=1